MATTKKHHAAIALALAECDIPAEYRLSVSVAVADALSRDGMSKGFDRLGFIALATIGPEALGAGND